jgi:dsRNA-specific ribonuclease
MFVIGAYLDDQEIGQGTGSSKKEAEQVCRSKMRLRTMRQDSGK